MKSDWLIYKLIVSMRQRLSLREDKADDAHVDAAIRNGVELRGTNLWVLIFAIFIASIGLNVNSTAVVIGAMLISPLMGPIMGVGYGIGIYDADLIRRSLKSLGFATLISLIVSTVYFFLTPLTAAESELLSRTTPSLWDVLIAFFGGLAGMIGATRTERSNIIPGVAIATALMPPLCTAGYGLANGNWAFFLGASYLYSINCVFIALASLLIIWVLSPSHKKFVDKATEKRMGRSLMAIVLLTLLPSIYLALQLVHEEVFNSKAQSFLNNQLSPKAHIAERNIDAANKKIEVTLIGEQVSPENLKEIESHFAEYNLEGTSLIVHQAKEQNINVTELKSNIVSELYKENLYTLEEKNKKIQTLRDELQRISDRKTEWRNISAELHAQYPGIREVLFSEAVQWKANEITANDKQIVLNIHAASLFTDDEIYKIKAWLKVRLKTDSIRLIFD